MSTNKVSKFTIQINDQAAEDFELVDNNNAIVEIKDTVTENTTQGTEQHTFKETTADGTENKVSDFLIAANQITSIDQNTDGDGFNLTEFNQAGNKTIKEIELSQVGINKSDIAQNKSDIAQNKSNLTNLFPLITTRTLTIYYSDYQDQISNNHYWIDISDNKPSAPAGYNLLTAGLVGYIGATTAAPIVIAANGNTALFTVNGTFTSITILYIYIKQQF